MTAAQLLTYISAALLLQVTTGIGVLVWRRRAAATQLPRLDEPANPATSTAAWPGWRDFRVIRRAYEDTTRSQCSFYLQPADGLALPSFRPGQYLTFSMPVGNASVGVADAGVADAGVADADVADAGAGAEVSNAGAGVGTAGRNITRCYSLSDRPDSSNYRITIKRMLSPSGRPELPPGVCSSHFLDRVQEGDILKVKAPSGQFFIDTDATVPVVFIAGGIGITPMISMLRWCAAEQPKRSMRLFYGVRSGVEQVFRPLLNELAQTLPDFKLHVVFSCPGSEDIPGRDYQHAGHIDIALLRAKLSPERQQFYVCGPPNMMQSLVPALRQWGVKDEDLHSEAFGPASARPAGSTTNEPTTGAKTSFEVRLKRSGRTLVWDAQDASLLEFAERQGVSVDAGCRSGSCGSCETLLVSGTVQYIEKPDYEIADGHCLLCVAIPRSALVLNL